MTEQSMLAGVGEARLYRYDPTLVEKYCNDNPFYQNIDGIIIPTTPELIVNYFHARRRIGSEESKVKFMHITNKLITDARKYVPIRINGKEEWVEKFGTS